MKQIFSKFIVLMGLAIGILHLSSCKLDRCKQRGIKCENEGVCFDGTCTCTVGWIGDSCNKPAYTPFLGYYGGTLITSPNSRKDFDTIHVTPGINNTTINFRSVVTTEKRDTFNVLARILDKRMFIESSRSVNGFTYNGTGSINKDIITMSFFKDSIGLNGLKYLSDTVTFVGNRVPR